MGNPPQILFLTTLLSTLVMCLSLPSPWPSYQHDYQFSNQANPGTSLPTPRFCSSKLKTSTSSHFKPDYFAIGHNVIVMASDGPYSAIYSYGSVDPVEEWDVNVVGLSYDGTCAFVTDRYKESFSVYNFVNKTLLWSKQIYDFEYFYNDKNDTLYLVGADTSLVDVKTGTVISSGFGIAVGDVFASNPQNHHLIYLDNIDNLYSVDPYSRNVEWKLHLSCSGNGGRLPKITFNEILIFSCGKSMTYGVNMSSGAITWSWLENISEHMALLTLPSLNQARVVLSSEDTLKIIDPYTGIPEKVSLRNSNVVGIITIGEYIIFSDLDGTWQVSYNDFGNTTLYKLVATGTVVAITPDGILYGIEGDFFTKGMSILSTVPCPVPIVPVLTYVLTAVGVVAGCLFVVGCCYCCKRSSSETVYTPLATHPLVTPQRQTPRVCPSCDGEGYIHISTRTKSVTQICSQCNGTGKV